jgi:DNA-binding winged helix-turn-helix (wHTH) protein
MLRVAAVISSASPPDQAVKLRLGELTFDPDARRLLNGEKELHLSPKAIDLLRMLIAHRPRALSKQELHEHLWPATFVSEANLASLIAEIREALGDTARAPRFIRTAHRFGYAFSGEAVEVSDSPPAIQPSSFCWLVKDGKRLPLQPGENILGRDEADIQIESPTVSRRHARIRISGTEALLEDLVSKNGTFINGERVSTVVRLKDGDEVQVGSVVSRFRMTLPKGVTATWSGHDPES